MLPVTPGAWSAPTTLTTVPSGGQDMGWIVSGSNAAGDLAAFASRGGVRTLWRYDAAARSWSQAPVPAAVDAGQAAAVTLDAAGTVTVVWDDSPQDQQVGALKAARFTAGTWSSPVTVARQTMRGRLAATVNSGGQTAAAWVDPDGATLVSRWSPDTAAWSPPTAVVPAPEGLAPVAAAVQVDVAVDGRGNVYVASWYGSNLEPAQTASLTLVSLDAATETWGAPRPLLQPDSSGPQTLWGRADVAADDAGHVAVVWAQGLAFSGQRQVRGQVFALRYDTVAAGWDDPVRVSGFRGMMASPLAAFDPRGDVMVAWGATDDVPLNSGLTPLFKGVQAARYDAAARRWEPPQQLRLPSYAIGDAGNVKALGMDDAGNATVAYLTNLTTCVYPPRDFNDDCMGTVFPVTTARYDAAAGAWRMPYEHPGTFDGGMALAVAPDGSSVLLAGSRVTLAAWRFAPPDGPGLVLRGMYRVLSTTRPPTFEPMTFMDPITTAAVGTPTWFIADAYGIPEGTEATLYRDRSLQLGSKVRPDLTVSMPWLGITAGSWQIRAQPGVVGSPVYATVPLKVTTVPRFGIASHTVRGPNVAFRVNPGNAIAPYQAISLTRNGRTIATATVTKAFTPVTITVANRPGTYQVKTPAIDHWEYGTRSGVTVLR